MDIREDVDDIFWDEANKRVYASCGEGFINVFQENGAGHFITPAIVTTARGARTSLFVPELKRLYLAIPQRAEKQAEIRVYAAGMR